MTRIKAYILAKTIMTPTNQIEKVSGHIILTAKVLEICLEQKQSFSTHGRMNSLPFKAILSSLEGLELNLKELEGTMSEYLETLNLK